MILIVAVVFSLVVGLLRGGRLDGLISLSLRWAPVALMAFAVQAYLIYRNRPAVNGALWGGQGLLLFGSQLMILAVLWANRQLAGAKWIACGLLLNLLVMAANGGWMPVTPEALVRTDQVDLVSSMASGTRVQSSKSIVLSQQETSLWFLSDIFVLAKPFPLPSVFSAGDVLVAGGIFLLLQSALLPPVPMGRQQIKQRSD
jgi:hypothetical protein